MALEDSVNDLVDATTDLLTAVNVSKATLDASVASAAGSATTTTANAAAASASQSAAATSATNAANSATQAANSATSAAAIVTGVASNRPSIRPSLLLAFADTKQLDPRITFSRASTGTYYDGKTVAKAEENLVTYSDQFDNVAWGKAGTTLTANTTSAPDGTSTADTLIETASTGFFQLQQGFATIVGAPYTYSIYLKKGSGSTAPNIIQLSFGLTGFGSTYANFNLNTGAVGTTSGLSASILSVGNGWYRCIITATATASVSSVNALCVFTNNNDGLGRVPSYTGAVTSDVYVWGAQVEQRSAVTAYTTTTTAPITNYIPVLQTTVSNDARFDHDPVTGESKGLFIEEQRTNLLTYSEQFDNSAWVLVAGSRTSNVNTAPDGTLTADQLTTSGTQSQIVQGLTIPSGATVTASCYFKQYGLTLPALVLLSNNNTTPYASATFDISTGTISVAAAASNGGTNPTASITSVGNGWYRCSLTVTYPAVTAAGLRISASGASGSLFLWGAQLEAGAFPTSYIPTVASQVTRSADVASMTGSNFSSWYRQDEGTLYAEVDRISATGYPGRFKMDDGTANNSIDIFYDAANNTSIAAITTNGVAQAAFYVAGDTRNTFTKTAFGWATNNANFAYNGSTQSVDTSCVISANIDRTRIANALTGYIRRIAYYPKRLSNTELQGITS